MLQKDKILLSVCLIIKNEEKYLVDCFESILNLADQIIVVDTGSNDSSISIAEKYGAQIFHFEWINDFSAARNYSLSKVQGEWILYLDADERLDPKSVKEIERIKNSKENAGYFCTVKSIDNENNRDNSMRYVRLFKNIKGIRFTGKVHEQIVPSLIENEAKIYNSKILINHLGYNISTEDKRKKALRNLHILEEEYKLMKSGYNAYQVANTYFILDDIENSTKYYEIASESNELSKAIKGECYSNMALSALKSFNSEKAVNYINKSIELNTEQPFTLLLASKIALQEGNKGKAEEYCKRAYLLNKKVLQEQILNEIQVYLESEEVIWYGLLLAYQNNNRENFNFYLNECKNHYRHIKPELSNSIDIIIGKFLSKQSISGKEESNLLNAINKHSANFIYTLLENNLSSVNEQFLTALYDIHRSDLSVIKIYSKFYSEQNDNKKAIFVLEENSNQVNKDPSAILYLVSFYLMDGDIEKAESWIEILEKNFNHITHLTPIIKNIKENISQINKN